MKVNMPLRYIALPLVLIVTLCLSQEVRADPFTVTSVVLTPLTVNIQCGSSATFTLVVKGTGARPTGDDLLWSVIDRDPISDDELIGETRFSVLGDVETGQWEETINFTLECTANCTLRGSASSSGESDPAIFVLIEFPSGLDAGRSNEVSPKCVPEPTTMLLLGTGLAGVAIKMRKKLGSRKSG